MNQLVTFFLSKTLFVKLLSLFVFLLGIFSYITNYKEVYPNVDYDAIMIKTYFPSASAHDVESSITIPLERHLKAVDGARRMVSISFENLSVIFIQLDSGQTTSREAKVEVKEIINRFKELPENAEAPEVHSKKSSSQPILEIGLSGEITTQELYEHSLALEKVIRKNKSAGTINFLGQPQPEIRVEAKFEQLRNRRISLSEIVKALKSQNSSTPGGVLEELDQQKESLVRTISKLKTKDDVKNVVVRSNEEGVAVKVNEIAEVFKDLRDSEISYRINGQVGIAILVGKKIKSDSIKLVRDLKSAIADYQKKHPKLKISYINDSSYYIERRVSTLRNNLLLGLSLTFIFLLLFFSWKATLVVSLGIPFAFLGTMIFFLFSGISLNLITMLGLVLVMGMITDDAIVIVENCYRYLEQGKKPLEAAIIGVTEVIRPITASILTTIMSFLPLMYMSGLFGEFVKYIPLAVISCLSFSLFESFFILPTHFSFWIKQADCRISDKKKACIHLKVFIEKYKNFIRKILFHRKKAGLCAFGLVVFTTLFAIFQMKFILFPQDGIEVFAINIHAPVGSTKSEVFKKTNSIHQILSQLGEEELKGYNFKVGIQQISPDDTRVKRGHHVGQFLIYLTSSEERDRNINEIIDTIRSQINIDKNYTVNFYQVKGGLPVGEPISIGLRGESYLEILEAVKEVEADLKNIDGVADLSNTYNLGKDEIQIVINTAEASAAHVDPTMIGRYIYLSQEGTVVTRIRGLQKDVEVRLMMEEGGLKSREDLLKLQIPNRFGQLIKLSAVARIQVKPSVTSLEHEDGSRQIRVLAEVDHLITSSSAVNKILHSKMTEWKKKHSNIEFILGGEYFDTKEGLQTLKRAFLITFLGIFFLLILTFQSYYQPLIILTTIPLGATAVIWSFLLHGRPLSFFALLSIVALSGVIVNNGIVFIDFVNQKRKKGFSSVDSILAAAELRFRPILLTTMTTACGILPTAYGFGGLDPFVVPVALGLGWGTFLGSIFTLIFLPVFLALLDDIEVFASKFKLFQS